MSLHDCYMFRDDIHTIPTALWPWWEVITETMKKLSTTKPHLLCETVWGQYSSIDSCPLPCLHLEVMVMSLSSNTHCFRPVSGTAGEVLCKLTSLDVSTSKQISPLRTNCPFTLLYSHLLSHTDTKVHQSDFEDQKFWLWNFLALTSNLLKTE